MAAPDIPAAKRAGLPVDLDRLATDGDDWLTPEDRYALKTHGVCAQLQPGVFMIRIRVPGGVLLADQARGLARIARAKAAHWLHLTTRQSVELHHVDARDVKDVLDRVARLGLSTRSACGHTLRNVVVSEDAGLGLDEPFDCMPDARLVADAIVARSAELNCVLPSRVNLVFGGSPRSREDALLNDGAFVSMLRDGRAGYEMWAGGSLGKAPQLAVRIADFVAREDVVAAAEALIEVFVANGDLDHPAKGRMKFVVESMGEDAFRAAFDVAFASARSRPQPTPPPVEIVGPDGAAAILGDVPPGGWSVGVRPQRRAGRVLLTVDVPMGDLESVELEALALLSDRYADGALTLSRDQNVVFRDLAVDAVARIRDELVDTGLSVLGESPVAAVRACTGSAVCTLGIAAAPAAAASLLSSPALARNSSVRVHVSGCPNSCAQHQAGDIGLAGTKVRIGGAVRDGYQVFLGADLASRRVGTVAGRVAAEDVPAVVDAAVGAWEAVRHGAETIGQTVQRLGVDAFAAHIAAVLDDRWATGPEPEETALAAR